MEAACTVEFEEEKKINIFISARERIQEDEEWRSKRLCSEFKKTFLLIISFFCVYVSGSSFHHLFNSLTLFFSLSLHMYTLRIKKNFDIGKKT